MLLLEIMFIIIFISILTYSYKLLNKKIKDINLIKLDLNIQLAQRFKIYENLILDIQKYTNYEETILADVIQYRTQSQYYKSKDDDVAQFNAENKISKLSNKIEIFLDEYKELNLMHNYKEDFLNVDNKINLLKEKYNITIEQYQKIKNKFPINIGVVLLKKKIDITYNYWK